MVANRQLFPKRLFCDQSCASVGIKGKIKKLFTADCFTQSNGETLSRFARAAGVGQGYFLSALWHSIAAPQVHVLIFSRCRLNLLFLFALKYMHCHNVSLYVSSVQNPSNGCPVTHSL